MKFTLLSFLLIPILSFAQIDTITSSNIERTYKIQLPTEYNEQKNYPIIFVLHGYYHENLGMPEYSGFDKFVDRDCIVVYPHGLKEEHGINYFWNSGGGLSENYGGVDDVKFIEDLIDELPNTYAIDEESVYVVGHSNGGMMSYRLAMELSHKITAMANLAGSMMFDNITPKSPVPILHIHGTADPAVPLTGSKHPRFSYLAIDDVLDKWVEWNECRPVADTLVNSKSYLHLKWSGKTNKNKVIVSYIKNQGHDWVEITKSGYDIAENIWSFFTTGELYKLED
jgi:polyhydroxybutyrate depolymerase